MVGKLVDLKLLLHSACHLFFFSLLLLMASETILSSSVAERSTVNRLVVGSNPTWGVLKTTCSITLTRTSRQITS